MSGGLLERSPPVPLQEPSKRADDATAGRGTIAGYSILEPFGYEKKLKNFSKTY
jgi:hypothetical protein